MSKKKNLQIDPLCLKASFTSLTCESSQLQSMLFSEITSCKKVELINLSKSQMRKKIL